MRKIGQGDASGWMEVALRPSSQGFDTWNLEDGDPQRIYQIQTQRPKINEKENEQGFRMMYTFNLLSFVMWLLIPPIYNLSPRSQVHHSSH